MSTVPAGRRLRTLKQSNMWRNLPKEGSNAWFGKEASTCFLKALLVPSAAEVSSVRKRILWMWFDSGVSHAAVLEQWKTWWPADLTWKAVTSTGMVPVILSTAIAALIMRRIRLS